MSQPAATTRRTFHVTFIYGLWSLIGAALSIPAAVYLLLPPRARKQGEWVTAADLDRLPTGAPQEVVFRRNRQDGWKISSEKTSAWLVKTAPDEVVAYSSQCTHLGCAFHWDERRKYFLCPCHTSTFSLDGKVTAGPAPRALDRYDVKIEGSQVLIGPLRKPDARG
jgi:menaquinol-cytochrome c reductase iron-sulfur subunit